MDRDAIARRRRRAQALEALEFERDREHALLEQIEQLVTEAEGGRIDAETFVRMDPADVAIVRELLGEEAVEEENDPFLEAEDGIVELDEPTGDEGGEDEVARLEGEIERSRTVQGALERYLAALDAAPG